MKIIKKKFENSAIEIRKHLGKKKQNREYKEKEIIKDIIQKNFPECKDRNLQTMRIHSSLQHNEKKQTHTISNHEQEDKDLKKKNTSREGGMRGKKKVTYKGS